MYYYESERSKLFTDDGQRMFIRVRDRVNALLAEAGAVRQQEAVSGVSGDSWTMLACLDRMVELGELRELTGPRVPGQYRVFVRA